MDFKDNVAESFKRVKDEMTDLNLRIYFIEENIKKIDEKLNKLLEEKTQKNDLQVKHSESSENIDELSQNNTNLGTFSTGNEGVRTHSLTHSLSTAAAPAQEKKDQESQNIINLESIQKLKRELATKFSHLTEAQLRVFLAIYRREIDFNGPVSYLDISEETGLTQGGVRSYVSDLILKNFPLIKTTSSKGKIFLTIDPAFRNLKMVENLLSLREKDYSQTRLNEVLKRNNNPY